MKMMPKKWIYLISIIIIALLIIVVGYYYLVYNATCEETLPGNGPGKGMGGYWTQTYTLLAISAVVIIAIVLISNLTSVASLILCAIVGLLSLKNRFLTQKTGSKQSIITLGTVRQEQTPKNLGYPPCYT